jgi:hypothetical protein
MDPDTLLFDLTVILPTNLKPEIYIDGLTPEEIEGVQRNVGESLDFKVFALDSQDDTVTMYVEGTSFNHETLGVSFPSKENPVIGTGYVDANFDWLIPCSAIESGFDFREYWFRFIAKDYQNKCRFKYADTLLLPVTVLLAINDPLPLVITNANPDMAFENNSLDVFIGQDIELNLKATDVSVNPIDKVRIELMGVSGTIEPAGYGFTPAEGMGGAQTSFTWIPDCSVFDRNSFESDYTFTFRTFDNRCSNVQGDTVNIDIHISDVERSPVEFLPPNIVTPNGDGCNDFFALEDFATDVGNSKCPIIATPSLPLDNCAGQFASIRIYNRWGKQVFLSSQRNFRWDPINEATGIYFYTIQYSFREGADRFNEYKGSITVRD